MSTFKPKPFLAAADTSAGADENPPILKMAEREDWSLFRSVEGLCQKAGVAKVWLQRLVLKELTDNALDEGTNVQCGHPDPENLSLFFVDDDGPGIDGTPAEIASLLSNSVTPVSDTHRSAVSMVRLRGRSPKS